MSLNLETAPVLDLPGKPFDIEVRRTGSTMLFRVSDVDAVLGTPPRIGIQDNFRLLLVDDTRDRVCNNAVNTALFYTHAGVKQVASFSKAPDASNITKWVSLFHV